MQYCCGLGIPIPAPIPHAPTNANAITLPIAREARIHADHTGVLHSNSAVSRWRCRIGIMHFRCLKQHSHNYVHTMNHPVGQRPTPLHGRGITVPANETEIPLPWPTGTTVGGSPRKRAGWLSIQSIPSIQSILPSNSRICGRRPVYDTMKGGKHRTIGN